MATTNREVNAKITLEGKSVGVKELRTEIENFGDAGKKGAQKLVDGFETVEKSTAKVEKAFASGRVASQTATGAMVVHFQNLEKAVIETFGSIEQAPEAVRVKLAQLGDQVDAARSRFIQTNAALRDQNATLNQAGMQFSSLGQAVEQAAGKHAAAVAKIGVFTFALREAYKVFREIGEATGVDYAPMTKLLTDLEGQVKKTGSAFHGFMGDVLLAVTNVGGELTDGEMSWKAYGNGIDHVIESAKALRAELQLTPEQMDVYNVLLRKGVEESQAFAVVTNNLAEAQKAYAGDLIDLTKIKEEAAKKTAQYKDNVVELFDALQKAQNAAVDAAGAVNKLSAAEEQGLKHIVAQQQVVNGNTQALANQYEQVERLLPQYDLHAVRIGQLVNTLKASLNAQDGLTAAQRAEHDELIKKIATYGKLTAEEQATITQKLALVSQLEAQASAVKSVTIAYENGQVVIKNAATETDKIAKATSDAAESTIKITKASGEAFGELEKLGGGFGALAAKVDPVATRLRDVDTALTNIISKADKAAEVLRALGQASEAAAGEE